MRKLILILGVFWIITACDDDSETTSNGGDSVEAGDAVEAGETMTELTPSASDLVGTWVGPCFPSPQGDGSYNQLTFVFTETAWELDYSAFVDDACTSQFLTVDIAGDYTLEGASATVDGAREGTFGFTTKTVTPHVEAAVGVVNGACGVTDAEVGVALDISGGCAGLGAYPIAECPSDYDIVRLNEDGTLAFGARPMDNNMCTPENRPTTFEGGAVVTKQ